MQFYTMIRHDFWFNKNIEYFKIKQLKHNPEKNDGMPMEWNGIKKNQ